MNKAVFLDRDGVVNKELGDYILRYEEFEILPELIPFLYEVRKRGFKFIIITNQVRKIVIECYGITDIG